VVQGEKRHLPGLIIQLCGAPTGQVNAFELTLAGFWLLFHGIGFRPWVDENLAETGDPLTEDYRPDRFNIGTEGGRIKELWFG
jgi:hypothetical protein